MKRFKIVNMLNDFLTIGAIRFKGRIRNIKLFQAWLKAIREGLNVDSPELNSRRLITRKLYKTFKIDPTKDRPSSEALLRRFKKGDFPNLHPIVDFSNTFSMIYQVPFGFYDVKKIEGETIILTIGEPDDSYVSTKKKVFSLSGRIVLKDKVGPFGNPSSDSIRTTVSKETEEFLLISFFHPEYPDKENVFYDIEKFLNSSYFSKEEALWKVTNERSFIL